MSDIALKKLIMAGPMRWIVLSMGGRVTTLAWFCKPLYTGHGAGTAFFARCDLHGTGRDEVFAVFSDNLEMAGHLRDDIFSYTAFAREQAPLVAATFESRADWPRCVVEKMVAAGGLTAVLSLWELGEPQAYVRRVSDRVTEVGAYAVPARFELTLNGVVAAGQAETGPLAEAPPVGADLQNLWYSLVHHTPQT